MNTVEPLRGKSIIEKFKDLLRSYSERDYVLFMTGLYLGRRISDILKLRVKDVRDRDYVYFREGKTGKESSLQINKDLKKIYKEYCYGKKGNDYLFRPLRGSENRPITRQQYWHILNKAAEDLGYEDKIGCHTLRKTLGRELYKKGVPITTIMLILNHSEESVTKRYIGVTNDEINEVLTKVRF